MLDAATAAVVRESWSTLQRDSELFVEFYKSLFRAAPDVQDFFVGVDIVSQAQMLGQLIELAVGMIDAPHALAPVLRMLGSRHVAYGATPDLYKATGGVLLGELSRVLGSGWTPPVAAAWAKLYEVMVAVMLSGSEGGVLPPLTAGTLPLSSTDAKESTATVQRAVRAPSSSLSPQCPFVSPHVEAGPSPHPAAGPSPHPADLAAEGPAAALSEKSDAGAAAAPAASPPADGGGVHATPGVQPAKGGTEGAELPSADASLQSSRSPEDDLRSTNARIENLLRVSNILSKALVNAESELEGGGAFPVASQKLVVTEVPVTPRAAALGEDVPVGVVRELNAHLRRARVSPSDVAVVARQGGGGGSCGGEGMRCLIM